MVTKNLILLCKGKPIKPSEGEATLTTKIPTDMTVKFYAQASNTL